MRNDACDPDLSADQLCRGEEAGLLRVVHVLQQLPSASLKNRTLLAELVRAVGLSNTGSFGGSRFYGSEQRYVLGPEDPSSRVRYGVCQLPEQLADALATLASLDKRIHTFAEVGTAGQREPAAPPAETEGAPPSCPREGPPSCLNLQ